MSYNTVSEILTVGRLNLTDFPQSEIEKAIDEAEEEIDLRIPPLTPGQAGYDRYARRLQMIKQAHAYLTLSYAFDRLPFDTIAHAEAGDPFGTVDMNFGAKTPEINTLADYYRARARDYRDKAETLIKSASYRIPYIKRPKAITL